MKAVNQATKPLDEFTDRYGPCDEPEEMIWDNEVGEYVALYPRWMERAA